MHRIARRTAALSPLLLALATSGCLLAAAGAAGGSAIYLTSRGAEAVVQGDLESVTTATEQAFSNLGVEAKGHKDTEEGRRDVYGKSGDNDVTVQLQRKTERATHVEVQVQKSAVTWDKDMAKRILQEIQKTANG